MEEDEINEMIEEQYWNYVHTDTEKTMKVEYAADIPAHEYSSGFPTNETDPYANHPWNFNIINKGENTLLQF